MLPLTPVGEFLPSSFLSYGGVPQRLPLSTMTVSWFVFAFTWLSSKDSSQARVQLNDRDLSQHVQGPGFNPRNHHEKKIKRHQSYWVSETASSLMTSMTTYFQINSYSGCWVGVKISKYPFSRAHKSTQNTGPRYPTHFRWGIILRPL
jgi:hypothetical protein